LVPDVTSAMGDSRRFLTQERGGTHTHISICFGVTIKVIE
jgi:hypothetical protein